MVKIRVIFLIILSTLSLPALSLLTLMLSSNASCAELPPAVRPEIAHLLDYMEQSPCEFFRNGTWYKDGKAIREHAELKIQYFLDRGKIKSTEDCITWAGSRSEISGKPYLVRCGSNPPEPTAIWLTREMNRYRKEVSFKKSEADKAGNH
jgi:hypothetical protein